MIKQVALAFALLCSVALGQAQTFEAAEASAKSDLDKALAELSALEKKIADEKIPLARELNTLERARLSPSGASIRRPSACRIESRLTWAN